MRWLNDYRRHDKLHNLAVMTLFHNEFLPLESD